MRLGEEREALQGDLYLLRLHRKWQSSFGAHLDAEGDGLVYVVDRFLPCLPLTDAAWD